MTTGDGLPAGTTETVTCNGTEVRVDVSADIDGVQSSEEAGGLCELITEGRSQLYCVVHSEFVDRLIYSLSTGQILFIYFSLTDSR